MDSATNLVVLLFVPMRFLAKFDYMWNIRGISRGSNYR